ncbi:MAG: DUF4271 domain-containing protein [Bacteroidales bacterium]|nr:DUF4271 domain-containing protein [Bacteroidales bacterium]
MLSFIPYLTLLILLFLVGNILSWMPKGTMREQWNSMRDTRNSRSFNNDEGALTPSSALLLCQWFLFFGIILYTYLDTEFFRHLSDPDMNVAGKIAKCVLIPIAWYFFQWVMFHWWGFLLHQGDRIQILSRIYRSVHLLAGSIALILFLLQMIGWIEPESSLFLLLLIFIIAQIIFIFSGIKIFWNGFGTLYYIFLYLCAFKIAPLLIIWTKI